MDLQTLLTERKDQLAQSEKAKQEILEQLNRCERNIIALQASILTIEEIMKGVDDESTK